MISQGLRWSPELTVPRNSAFFTGLNSYSQSECVAWLYSVLIDIRTAADASLRVPTN